MTFGFVWPWVKRITGVKDPTFEMETHAMSMDIAQLKRLNDFLLDKALARHWISREQAEAIKTVQSSSDGGLSQQDAGHFRPTE